MDGPAGSPMTMWRFCFSLAKPNFMAPFDGFKGKAFAPTNGHVIPDGYEESHFDDRRANSSG